MKKFIHILAAAAFLIGAASCQVIQEDAYSTDPVAPEFVSHGDIIITANTMGEDVNFTWTPYKNLPDGLLYTLKATYVTNQQVLQTTDRTTYKTTKTAFKELLYATFPELPVNDSFVLSFEVSVTDGDKTYASSTLGINVYAYGDAIAPVIMLAAETVELDPTTPTAELVLLSWEPARLVLGEEVSYDVLLGAIDHRDASGAPATKNDAVKRVEIATGLKETSFSMTTDALNEAIVNAGGSEAADVDVTFFVRARCASLPEGITATSATMLAKTYLATFPDQFYLPGSHQDWSPATAPVIRHSTTQKGLFEGFVDLRTSDGSDVQFKFSPVPEWKDDFGGKVETDQSAGGFAHAKGSVGVSDNISVPSGFYFISLNKKLNTIEMVQVNQLSMIGSSVGDFSWGQDADLSYDAQAQAFVIDATEMKAGEFKFRFNHDWTYSLGGTADAVAFNGGNIAFAKKDSRYKVILDVSKVPFSLKFMDLDFPDLIYIPGSHNDWRHTMTILKGDGEGHYAGFTKIGGEWGFKLTDRPGWESDGATVWGLDGGVDVRSDAVTGMTISAIAEGGGNIMEGSATAYSYVYVDLANNQVRTVPVTGLGIIGGFNGWAGDYVSFTYDEAQDIWTASRVEIQKGVEWKIRSNQDWDNGDFTRANLGFGPDNSFANLAEHGGNMKLDESGIFDLTLSIATYPFMLNYTKVGDLDGPALPEEMYMVGEGIVDWGSFLPMTPFHSQNGMFWAIRHIEAGKGFKFSPEPNWGKDFCQLDTNEGFTVEGGNCFVAESGIYCIGIDADGGRLIIEPAKVYGIGGAWGGDWPPANGAALFQVNGTKLEATVASDGNVRTFVHSKVLSSVNDWWHAEFIPSGGQIVYRGTGGDPAEVAVTAGQKIVYDFNAGTGVVE